MEVMSGFIRHDWSAGRNPTGGTPVPRSMGILPMSGPDRQPFTFADITSNCTPLSLGLVVRGNSESPQLNQGCQMATPATGTFRSPTRSFIPSGTGAAWVAAEKLVAIQKPSRQSTSKPGAKSSTPTPARA